MAYGANPKLATEYDIFKRPCCSRDIVDSELETTERVE